MGEAGVVHRLVHVQCDTATKVSSNLFLKSCNYHRTLDRLHVSKHRVYACAMSWMNNNCFDN